MQRLAQGSLVVDCTVSLAFATLSNMERFGDWFPQVLAITSANDLPHGVVGKRYLETVAIPLRGPRQIEITVKEAVADRRFVTEGRFPPLLPRMEVSFEVLGSRRTAIEWTMYSRTRNPLVRLLLLPLARRVLQKRAQLGLARLKHQLETAG